MNITVKVQWAKNVTVEAKLQAKLYHAVVQARRVHQVANYVRLSYQPTVLVSITQRMQPRDLARQGLPFNCTVLCGQFRIPQQHGSLCQGPRRGINGGLHLAGIQAKGYQFEVRWVMPYGLICYLSSNGHTHGSFAYNLSHNIIF